MVGFIRRPSTWICAWLVIVVLLVVWFTSGIRGVVYGMAYAPDEDPCDHVAGVSFEQNAGDTDAGEDSAEWKCEGVFGEGAFETSNHANVEVRVFPSAERARSHYEETVAIDAMWVEPGLSGSAEPAEGDWERGVWATNSEEVYPSERVEVMVIQDDNLYVWVKVVSEDPDPPEPAAFVEAVMKGLAY